METHDIFISHSSATKELARHIYYNAISNGLQPWYDEAFLNMGDDLDPTIAEGIQKSKSFLLIHSKAAMEKRWVPMEMEIAKEKYENDHHFRLLVIKLDDEPLPNDGFWDKFLYGEWSSHDQAGSIIKILEGITGRKGIVSIAAASVLTPDPSSVFVNESCTVAEHSRNYVLWYFSHVKQLLNATINVGHEQEIRDTLAKILELSMFENIPNIQGGFIPVAPGVFEIIHANRMRIPPKISLVGLPSRYKWSLEKGNEVFTRFKIHDASNNQLIEHPVPLAISIKLDARL